MYNRTVIRLMGFGAAGIAVVVEILMFYSVFVQFDLLLSGSAPSIIVRNDIIFYALITALAVWAHELANILIELGDRMESRGDMTLSTLFRTQVLRNIIKNYLRNLLQGIFC